MKVARTVNDEGGEPAAKFTIKIFNHATRRAKTQTRAPDAGIDDGEIQRLISPRVVEIEIKCDAQRNLSRARFETVVALPGQTKIFLSLG